MTWSPLPWRESGDGYTIVDSDGVRVASVPYEDDRSYIVEAANAYPGLKARLDKALEACRALVAFLDWCTALSLGDYEAADKIMPRSEVNEGNWHPLLRRAGQAAREALEMAESGPQAEAESGDHRPSRCTAYHTDDPRLKPEPLALRITVDINGVTATSTLRPRAGGKATAEDLEKAVVAVARMAAQMITRPDMLKIYPMTSGYTEGEIERGEHWLYADVTCPHCGKLQPVAVTHYVGGPCCECGRPTGVRQERDRRG